MAESNGDSETRMDRIEKALESFSAGHEEFQRDYDRLRISQVALSAQIAANARQIAANARQIAGKWPQSEDHGRQLEAERAERKETAAVFDARVDRLVTSIRELIARIPPAAQRQGIKRQGYDNG